MYYHDDITQHEEVHEHQRCMSCDECVTKTVESAGEYSSARLDDATDVDDEQCCCARDIWTECTDLFPAEHQLAATIGHQRNVERCGGCVAAQ